MHSHQTTSLPPGLPLGQCPHTRLPLPWAGGRAHPHVQAGTGRLLSQALPSSAGALEPPHFARDIFSKGSSAIKGKRWTAAIRHFTSLSIDPPTHTNGLKASVLSLQNFSRSSPTCSRCYSFVIVSLPTVTSPFLPAPPSSPVPILHRSFCPSCWNWFPGFNPCTPLDRVPGFLYLKYLWLHGNL